VARALLIRGMLSGLVAGVLASTIARLIGEPAVSSAIAFEQRRAVVAGAGPYVEIVGRDLQSTLGLLTAITVYGISLGGLFALTFVAVFGRVRPTSPARTAAWLAAGAFVVVSLVPFLKYPANPPAVGRPETLGTRTSLYLAMLLISLGGAIYSVWLSRRLTARLGGHALLVAIAAYLLIVLAGGLLLPSVDEVPDGFSAVTLWDFRVGSIGVQAVTWAGIGLTFSFLAQRALGQGGGAARAPT
jgi:putative cobalt transporter subunit CbtA